VILSEALACSGHGLAHGRRLALAETAGVSVDVQAVLASHSQEPLVGMAAQDNRMHRLVTSSGGCRSMSLGWQRWMGGLQCPGPIRKGCALWSPSNGVPGPEMV